MHVAFIPYGIRSAVEHLLRDMEAQKFKLVMRKGDKVDHIWFSGSVRILPAGVIEYVFPRESLDLVMTTLDFDKPLRYEQRGMLTVPLALTRKALGLKKAPEKFDNSKKLMWIRHDVNIIPVGIREDVDHPEPDGFYKGWIHEAL